jgi:hypothetical protein
VPKPPPLPPPPTPKNSSKISKGSLCPNLLLKSPGGGAGRNNRGPWVQGIGFSLRFEEGQGGTIEVHGFRVLGLGFRVHGFRVLGFWFGNACSSSIRLCTKGKPRPRPIFKGDFFPEIDNLERVDECTWILPHILIVSKILVVKSETPWRGCCLLRPCHAPTVKFAALGLVAEDFVRLGQLLECRFGVDAVSAADEGQWFGV